MNDPGDAGGRVAAARVATADAVAAISSGANQTFLDVNSGAVAGVSPASVSSGGTIIESTGTTATALTADAKTAMRDMNAAKVPLSQCVWAISQSAAILIASTLTGTTNEPVWEDFKVDGTGTWIGGLPALVSGDIAGSQSATEAQICLIHGDSVAVADSGTATLDVGRHGALEWDDAPSGGARSLTSLWQNDLYAVRVSRFINWQLLRAAGCVTIKGINV